MNKSVSILTFIIFFSACSNGVPNEKATVNLPNENKSTNHEPDILEIEMMVAGFTDINAHPKAKSYGQWYGMRFDERGNKFLKLIELYEIPLNSNHFSEAGSTEPQVGYFADTKDQVWPTTLFRGEKFKEGPLATTVPTSINNYNPGKSHKIKLGPLTYVLSIDGEKVNDQDHFKNYTMTVSHNGVSQKLPVRTVGPDGATSIIWMGDLDRDGKLDLLISNPKRYSESRQTLLLSSYVDSDKLFSVVGELTSVSE